MAELSFASRISECEVDGFREGEGVVRWGRQGAWGEYKYSEGTVRAVCYVSGHGGGGEEGRNGRGARSYW